MFTWFAMMNPNVWMRAGFMSVLVIAFQVLVAHTGVQKETKRRFQHALTGHAMVQISYMVPYRGVLIVMLGLAASFIAVLQKYFPSQFKKAVGPLLRQHEFNELPGAFWFVVGTAATLLLINDWAVVRYAIQCLSFADPMASWVGSSIKSRQINRGSSLSGCLACFATAMAVGNVMLSDPSLDTLCLGAITCTLAEALPYGNDNLNIPIMTGLVTYHYGR